MLHSFSIVVVFQAQISIDKTKLGEFKQNMNQKVEYFIFIFRPSQMSVCLQTTPIHVSLMDVEGRF